MTPLQAASVHNFKQTLDEDACKRNRSYTRKCPRRRPRSGLPDLACHGGRCPPGSPQRRLWRELMFPVACATGACRDFNPSASTAPALQVPAAPPGGADMRSQDAGNCPLLSPLRPRVRQRRQPHNGTMAPVLAGAREREGGYRCQGAGWHRGAVAVPLGPCREALTSAYFAPRARVRGQVAHSIYKLGDRKPARAQKPTAVAERKR